MADSTVNYDLTNVVTPINVEKLKILLMDSKYNRTETEFLVQGFKNGFDLGYEGPIFRQSKSNNLPFHISNRQILWSKLMKEVAQGRVAGPYDKIPFDNYIQSPMGLVPKDSGTKTHLIFHLSYDFSDFRSVNYHIPPEKCTVKYQDLDTVVNLCLRLIWKGAQEVYFSKTDGRSAFCTLPLNPQSWKWVIMKAVNPQSGNVQYFVDKCVPFGASISCALFQQFSNALKHLAEFWSGRRNYLTNYLDDFLFLASLLATCNDLMENFLELCHEVGFPISLDKTHWAALRIVFLGILLDSKFLTLSIPLEKRICAQHLIEKFIHKRKATVRELQQLCGYLNFLNRAVFPGRAFTRHMYAKYAEICNIKKLISEHPQGIKIKKTLKSYHHVQLGEEFKLDCKVWKQSLDLDYQNVVNHPMIDLAMGPISALDLGFTSDASASVNLGFGCTLGNSWIYAQWEPGFIDRVQPSIEYLELFALYTGIFTWEYELKNMHMKVLCDDQSVVWMINNLSSSCRHCMYFLCLLVLNGLQFNQRVVAQHIMGTDNKMSDALSRNQLDCFRHVAPPGMKQYPDKISETLWPLSKLWY